MAKVAAKSPPFVAPFPTTPRMPRTLLLSPSREGEPRRSAGIEEASEQCEVTSLPVVCGRLPLAERLAFALPPPAPPPTVTRGPPNSAPLPSSDANKSEEPSFASLLPCRHRLPRPPGGGASSPPSAPSGGGAERSCDAKLRRLLPEPLMLKGGRLPGRLPAVPFAMMLLLLRCR